MNKFELYPERERIYQNFPRMVTIFSLLYQRDELSGDVIFSKKGRDTAHFGNQFPVIRTILEDKVNWWELMGRKM